MFEATTRRLSGTDGSFNAEEPYRGAHPLITEGLMRIRYIILIAISILLTAYGAHAEGPKPNDVAASEDIVSIFEALETHPGDATAVEALTRYVAIETKPAPRFIDEALLRLGRARAAGKDLAGASTALQRLLTDYPASRVKFDALFELANVRRMQGADADARSLLEAIVMSVDAPVALQARARLLLKLANAASGAPISDQALTPLSSLTPSIGALLPLKGSYARYGNEALRGILLAANTFAETGSPIEVIARDVEQSGDSVISTVEELASNQRVAGLIGPLLSTSALDAAAAAQRKKLPIITLSQREGLLDAGDYVYRNFLTPQAQAAYLAEYACKVLGRKFFVVIYPQNNYGIELAKHFSAEAIRQGCSITAEASYPPDTTDFGHVLSQAFDIKVKETKIGRRVTKEYTSQVPADALYMPDSFEAASLLAPYLEYYGITGVQLLGSSAWNSPGIAESGDKHLDGAVFVDGFFADSGRPETKEFTTRYRDVYGAPPGMIEAYSYDAAMLLIASMTSPDIGADRSALNVRLKGIKAFKGATGDLSIEANGEVKRQLFVLTLKNGHIIEASADKQSEPAKKTEGK